MNNSRSNPLSFSYYRFCLLVALAAGHSSHALADNGREFQGQIGGKAASSATQAAIIGSISSLGAAGVFRLRLSDSDGQTAPTLAEGKGGLKGLAASGDSDSPWTLWATPVLSNVSNRIAPATSEGSVNILLLGLEHNQDDELIRGVVLALDRADLDTPYNSGKVKGNGYTIAPYLAMPFAESWLLDASVGFGKMSLKTNVSNITASPEDVRQLASIGLSHSLLTKTKWLVSSKAGYSYSTDKVESYKDSAASITATSKTTLGQVKIGVQATYLASKFKPFVAAYQFFNDFSVSGGSATQPKEYSTTPQLQLGISPSSGPLYASVVAQVERGRSAVRAYVGYRY